MHGKGLPFRNLEGYRKPNTDFKQHSRAALDNSGMSETFSPAQLRAAARSLRFSGREGLVTPAKASMLTRQSQPLLPGVGREGQGGTHSTRGGISMIRIITVAAAMITLACSPERGERSRREDQAPVISDQAHSGEVPGFFFLPPLVPEPTTSGVFDSNASPLVRIDSIEPVTGTSVRVVAQ